MGSISLPRIARSDGYVDEPFALYDTLAVFADILPAKPIVSLLTRHKKTAPHIMCGAVLRASAAVACSVRLAGHKHRTGA